ncbi:MAG TPA: DUF2214 family protein [Methylocella sp.]|nr:DUF2214 family protein [Methylocella sp.]
MLDLDLVLAILHHFFVFALFGVLFLEFVVARRGMDAAARVVPIDAWYGVLAALIVIVGFSRAIFAAKGARHAYRFWREDVLVFLALASNCLVGMEGSRRLHHRSAGIHLPTRTARKK